MRPQITFDNQLSTGIQAFGHCGSPTCCMTSSFGANPEEPALAVQPQTETDRAMAVEREQKQGTALLIALAVYVVSVSIIFTKKYHDYTK